MAKTVVTLDHVSNGRAILGMGAAWFEPEHRAHGIDFGAGVGERLDWLDEAVGIMRRLLDGEEVTHAGPHYQADHLRHAPRPIQERLPIMIGGSGEQKTLRTVARYADMWNAMGPPDFLRHKDEVLRERCVEVGRDEAEIERTVSCKLVIRDDRDEARRVWEGQMAHNRTDPAEERYLWLGPPEEIAQEMRACMEAGFRTPHRRAAGAVRPGETIERLIGEVRPLLEA